MSTDAGPMLEDIENILFPAPGPGGTCVAEPATLRNDLGAALGTALVGDVPSLTPTAAADPMAVSADAADVGMPLITSHYAPYAPSVSPSTFMAGVSVKPADYADSLRTTDADLAEFLEWYASDNATTRALISGVCGLDRAWWESYTTWLMGTSHESTHRIRERSALFDTFNTTVAGSGTVELGPCVHRLGHPGDHHPRGDAPLRAQRPRGPGRSPRGHPHDHRHLHRGHGRVPGASGGGSDGGCHGRAPAPPPSIRPWRPRPRPTDRTSTTSIRWWPCGICCTSTARTAKTRSSGRFFLGEGWRFGLLEGTGTSSPIESDRPVPPPTDVHFATGGDAASDLATLTDLVDYLKGRSIATVAIVGRTDPVGREASNDALGTRRANAVRTWLVGQGHRCFADQRVVPRRAGSDPGGQRRQPSRHPDGDRLPQRVCLAAVVSAARRSVRSARRLRPLQTSAPAPGAPIRSGTRWRPAARRPRPRRSPGPDASRAARSRSERKPPARSGSRWIAP